MGRCQFVRIYEKVLMLIIMPLWKEHLLLVLLVSVRPYSTLLPVVPFPWFSVIPPPSHPVCALSLSHTHAYMPPCHSYSL